MYCVSNWWGGLGFAWWDPGLLGICLVAGSDTVD
jgi:hypothetical protein